MLSSAATGRLTNEISVHLGLTPDAVRAVLASAMVKLGARSKLEAVIIAVRTGLINLPSP